MLQPDGAVVAVQLRVVPVVVVPDAAKPLGRLGAPKRPLPPPPLLLLPPPPQDGSRTVPVSSAHTSIAPTNFLRCRPAPSNPPPARTIPTGSHMTVSELRNRRVGFPATAAVVLTVSVEVPEPPLIEFELNWQVGAGVPPPLTLHVKLTVLL